MNHYQSTKSPLHTPPSQNSALPKRNLFLDLLQQQFSSVAQSCPTFCDPMECCTPGFPVHHQLLDLAQTHVHWVSDAIHFSSCFQSFPASGSFPISQLFSSGGQNIGVSALASVLPINIQNGFPLGLTGLISLLSKALSRVFSSTTVQKHQFFGAQLFLWYNSHIHTWLLEKPKLWLDRPMLSK